MQRLGVPDGLLISFGYCCVPTFIPPTLAQVDPNLPVRSLKLWKGSLLSFAVSCWILNSQHQSTGPPAPLDYLGLKWIEAHGKSSSKKASPLLTSHQDILYPPSCLALAHAGARTENVRSVRGWRINSAKSGHKTWTWPSSRSCGGTQARDARVAIFAARVRAECVPAGHPEGGSP